ncbi:MAG TPA: bacillithiol biosynthesis cysteine-adding enzyme BshC [Flavobacteriales bacterium]|nr:bacillithiol biosynthesis cysteine-adding enzyme BshC [Flavobacteriales bacterium]HIN39012.1 bacillithiol biosynthesis cysteine-adding enzyme BshC [Flavobacteriales bacterium]
MKFKTNQISLADLYKQVKGKKLYSPLVWDYINNKKKLRPLYNFQPSIEGLEEAIKKRTKFNINRNNLVSVLKEQYQDIPVKPKNIDLLKEANTFTVTTGHQLCLFMGPAYVAYKILSTINLTEQLKRKYPDYNFVPIYWMASEDHDFEEINHLALFNKKIEWYRVSGGPVGRMNIANMDTIVADIFEIIGEDKKYEKLFKLISDAYLKQNNLADATRSLVNDLFGSYGLVVLDADHKDLKASFAGIMLDELENRIGEKKVNKTIAKLAPAYKLPVKPQPINLFYLEDHLRTKIEYNGEQGYKIGERSNIDVETLKSELSNNPERFSPNVVLRPIYQEHILPNLAYIGGPSEIAYWLEFKELFEHYKVNFPALIVRKSAVIIGKAANSKIKRLKLDISNLFNEDSQVIKTYVKSQISSAVDLESDKKRVEALYENIHDKLICGYPSLRNRIAAEKKKAINSLTYLKKKMDKADKQKYEIEVHQIHNLIDTVFPNGIFQERHESLLSLLVRYDLELIKYLKETINPLDNSINFISEAG